MYCPKCGNQNPDTAVYCASCGEQMKPRNSGIDQKGAYKGALKEKLKKLMHNKRVVLAGALAAFIVVIIIIIASAGGNSAVGVTKTFISALENENFEKAADCLATTALNSYSSYSRPSREMLVSTFAKRIERGEEIYDPYIWSLNFLYMDYSNIDVSDYISNYRVTTANEEAQEEYASDINKIFNGGWGFTSEEVSQIEDYEIVDFNYNYHDDRFDGIIHHYFICVKMDGKWYILDISNGIMERNR